MPPSESIKDKIISALMEAQTGESPISGEWLAQKIAVSRSDINKHIKQLRELGYKITARPRRGYFWGGAPSMVTFENIEIFLKKTSPTVKVEHYKITESTQTLAKNFALKNNPTENEWRVFVSDRQTGGYGRLRRAWFSSKGGLWFSLLIPKPPIETRFAPAFSLAFSVAVRSAMEKTAAHKDGNKFFLKWPNDIVAFPKENDGYKKVAGIITEISADIQQIQWLVAGCGVNISNRLPTEISSIATTMSEIAGKEISPPLLLKEIIIETQNIYRIFCTSGFGGFLKKEYESHDVLRGKEVTISSADGKEMTGIAASVDDEGHLLLAREYRKNKFYCVKKVFAGDVTIKKIR